jgi:hypothetical protein
MLSKDVSRRGASGMVDGINGGCVVCVVVSGDDDDNAELSNWD